MKITYEMEPCTPSHPTGYGTWASFFTNVNSAISTQLCNPYFELLINNTYLPGRIALN